MRIAVAQRARIRGAPQSKESKNKLMPPFALSATMIACLSLNQPQAPSAAERLVLVEKRVMTNTQRMLACHPDSESRGGEEFGRPGKTEEPLPPEPPPRVEAVSSAGTPSAQNGEASDYRGPTSLLVAVATSHRRAAVCTSRRRPRCCPSSIRRAGAADSWAALFIERRAVAARYSHEGV